MKFLGVQERYRIALVPLLAVMLLQLLLVVHQFLLKVTVDLSMYFPDSHIKPGLLRIHDTLTSHEYDLSTFFNLSIVFKSSICLFSTFLSNRLDYLKFSTFLQS